MDYREEVEKALCGDNTEYGKVWRGEKKTNKERIWKQLNVMLKKEKVETTPGQKERWTKRLNNFASRHCLSKITKEEIARRAERCILEK